MKKLFLFLFFLGCTMTAGAANLADFDKYWNFNNPVETEVKFREILAQAEKSEGLDLQLQIRTQIARTQGLQRKFSEAHATLDSVEKTLNSATIVAEIRYNLERGRVFNSSNKKNESLPYFHKGFDLALAQKQDNLAVDVAHMVAIAESEPEKQMEWNLKALKIAEDSQDPKAQGWLGSLYNNIGWTYHDSGKFNEALELFQKAQAFREKKGEPSSIRIAKWCVARAYRSLGRLDESLQIQKALEAEFEQISQKDGYVFEELGELYLLKGMKSEAQKYFAMAYQELSKDEWFKQNEAKRLARIKELGER